MGARLATRLLMLLTLAPLACRETDSHPAASVRLSPCHLTGSAAEVVDALCGHLEVPEDRDRDRASKAPAEKGRTLSLAIAVVKATGRKPARDAIFFLAGGPGQSALAAYPSLAGSFSKQNLSHDIVLVDQRGTGRSAALSCPETGMEETTEGPAEAAAVAARCREELEKRADLRQYTTTIAMDDLDDVRAALGYDTVDLYGASYGTRAALVYLRRHEEHVRAVVLDGVAPFGWALAASFGEDGQRALDLVFARCDADAACHAAFPDLPKSLAALLAARDGHESPEKVVVPHPVTAAPATVTVSRDTLASTLHALSYESETAALLPLLIHTAAASGDLRPLAAESLIVADALKLDVGEHLAVACSEDAPFLDLARIARDSAGTYLRDAAARRYVDTCRGWPRAEVSPADRADVVSRVPVLLLSGELDPVTPPTNATLAAKGLSNSLAVTVPGEGHGALTRSCIRRIVDDFLARASVSGLHTECLRDTKPMRFFTRFAGPEPVIEVSSIHKEFGAVVAVDDVSFVARDGAITALLGANGAGKTTTLRIITAVFSPDRGAVKVDGRDTVTDARSARARVGLLSDQRGLYGRLTTRENVRYFGRLHGLEGAPLEARIDHLVKLLDMPDIEHRRVDGFSLGQKLKVGIARALVHDPPNVLLDEPTAGLDVMTTRAMREVVRRLREEGKCVLLSSHVMQEVARLSDQVVIVARGKVRVVATPDELRAQTGCDNLEDAFVKALGSDEGLMA